MRVHEIPDETSRLRTLFSNCASNKRKEIKFCRMKSERDKVLQLIKITKILCLGGGGDRSGFPFAAFRACFELEKKTWTILRKDDFQVSNVLSYLGE